MRLAHLRRPRADPERLPVHRQRADGSPLRPADAPGPRVVRPAQRADAARDARSSRTSPGAATSSSTSEGRIWSATKTNHLFVLRVAADGRSFEKVDDFDLTSAVVGNERISSALPDFRGRIWFVTKANGKVGVLNTKTRRIRVLRTGEEIENSFTIDRDASLHRLRQAACTASARGATTGRAIDWQVRYDNSGHRQARVRSTPARARRRRSCRAATSPSRTTPTRCRSWSTGPPSARARRVVCEVPVFQKGASATENSLLGSGRSLIVENNFGYVNPFDTANAGKLTTPGFARVDVNRNGRGCRKVWETRTERGASRGAQALDEDPDHLHLHPGRRRRAGPGAVVVGRPQRAHRPDGVQAARRHRASARNNNYAGLAIGPDGTAYLGHDRRVAGAAQRRVTCGGGSRSQPPRSRSPRSSSPSSLRGGGDDSPPAGPFAGPAVADATLRVLDYDPDRRAWYERRAAAGLSHVLYAKSPGGAIASAQRTAALAPADRPASPPATASTPTRSRRSSCSRAPGAPTPRPPRDLEGAVGLTQILAQTGRDLLGMRIDVAASERLTRGIARGRARPRARGAPPRGRRALRPGQGARRHGALPRLRARAAGARRPRGGRLPHGRGQPAGRAGRPRRGRRPLRPGLLRQLAAAPRGGLAAAGRAWATTPRPTCGAWPPRARSCACCARTPRSWRAWSACTRARTPPRRCCTRRRDRALRRPRRARAAPAPQATCPRCGPRSCAPTGCGSTRGWASWPAACTGPGACTARCAPARCPRC